ncbi:MAG: TolC family protein [Desulfobacterales bacterium]|uniref:TolC family protein n=1 Tax=Candidatus Desulfatibia vada TaxID=2841696 RepID=A0A8J6P035_9BACT|nr:TolC family protein [Candidatus Desulfatibia vada]
MNKHYVKKETVYIWVRAFNILILILLVFAFFSSSTQAESLDELLDGLIKNHEKIKAAEANVSAAKYGVKKALGDWLPQLDLTAYAGVEQHAKHYPTKTLEPYDPRKAEFELTQLVYDFGKTGSAVKKAELTLRQREATLVAVRQRLIQQGISAYLNVLKSVKIFQFARHSEANVQKQTGMEQARVQEGVGYSTDVLQAKQQLAGAQARRVRFEGALINAINRYRNVFKAEPDIKTMRLVKVPASMLPAALEDGLKTALDNNPQILSQRYALDIAKQSIRSALSSFFPKVELIGKAQFKYDDGGVEGQKDEYLGKVELTYPLLSGFADLAELKASKDLKNASQNQLTEIEEQIREQTRNSWQNIITKRNDATFLRNQANLSAEFFKLAQKERQLGRRSLLDVLAGETTLINAKSDALAAEYDMIIAAYDLLAAMGQLEIYTIEMTGETINKTNDKTNE